MRAKFKDLLLTRNGEQIVTLTVSEDIRDLYDDLQDVDLDVTIKKHRERRSLDANAYCWVLIDRLAEKMNESKETIYRNAIRDIGGVSEIVCVKEKAFPKLKEGWQKNGIGWQVEQMPSKIDGCVNAILYYGSSTYDKKQMGDLIDRIVQDCKEIGIPTETPEQIEKMKSLWANAPKGKL